MGEKLRVNAQQLAGLAQPLPAVLEGVWTAWWTPRTSGRIFRGVIRVCASAR